MDSNYPKYDTYTQNNDNNKKSVLSASVIEIITDALVIFAYRQVILLSQLYFAMQSFIFPFGKVVANII